MIKPGAARGIVLAALLGNLMSDSFLSDRAIAASGHLVNFTVADGTTLSGMLYETSNRPAPGVVLVHMLGRTKDEWSTFAERLQDAGATALAFDLRGHGSSGGNGAELAPMIEDVREAIEWLAARPGVRPGTLGVVGSSLGANLAALAATDVAAVRAVAMISPSLDYRGVRIDSGVMRQLGHRSVWLAASSEDPYALRTLKELASGTVPREQQLSSVRGHGTRLLTADQELARALVDWLRQTLLF